MTDSTPYTVPKEPGRLRAIVLAVLVHAALFVFLWIGVRWQSNTPTTIEAEVWSPQPHEAAPQPEPVKQPQPVKAPPVVKEAPKPVAKEPPVENPDIALEREKKRKAEQEKKRLEEERQAMLKKKAEEERLAKQKAEQKRLEKLKAEKKKAAEEAKKAAEEAARKQEEQLAKLREEEMKRITGGVTGTGGAGSAPQSQGGRADGSYAQRVATKIKSNITFSVPEDLTTNPPVEYQVDLLPDGSVAGIRKLKSSGVPGFDDAVLRAIQKSQPYPKDKSGSVPSSFIGTHKPKDQ